MQPHLSRSEFVELAQRGNLIPVVADLMADLETPVSVFAKLAATGSAYLLESIEGGATLNRYSFIGCNPRELLVADHDGTTIRDRDGNVIDRVEEPDPLKVLQARLSDYHPVELPDIPPFSGGAVGYIGYETIRTVEPTVPLAEKDPLGMPLAWFAISDQVVVFDRARQTLRLIVNAHIAEGADPATVYDEAVTALGELRQRLEVTQELAPTPLPDADGALELPNGNFTRERFETAVEACKEYIRAGDFIQIVLSQRFELEVSFTPLELYRALRTVNPSPYMFLIQAGDFALVGASPEVHVRLTGKRVEIRPIAGTRPRGIDHAADVAFEKDLLADEKELAEHLMLVDLARNDIGRVCDYGSVHVPDYQLIERYSHVMHIVSQVEGELLEGRDAYDLMRATFPAGTVSGAPKVRAMQVIAEQEAEQRGPYAGAVCYFSFNGNLDSCIAIRTALMRNRQLYLQSGAGIVADSIPSREYDETVNKAKGLLRAVRLAEGLHSL